MINNNNSNNRIHTSANNSAEANGNNANANNNASNDQSSNARPLRINGWARPYHQFQIITWCGVAYLLIVYYSVIVPSLVQYYDTLSTAHTNDNWVQRCMPGADLLLFGVLTLSTVSFTLYLYIYCISMSVNPMDDALKQQQQQQQQPITCGRQSISTIVLSSHAGSPVGLPPVMTTGSCPRATLTNSASPSLSTVVSRPTTAVASRRHQSPREQQSRRPMSATTSRAHTQSSVGPARPQPQLRSGRRFLRAPFEALIAALRLLKRRPSTSATSASSVPSSMTKQRVNGIHERAQRSRSQSQSSRPSTATRALECTGSNAAIAISRRAARTLLHASSKVAPAKPQASSIGGAINVNSVGTNSNNNPHANANDRQVAARPVSTFYASANCDPNSSFAARASLAVANGLQHVPVKQQQQLQFCYLCNANVGARTKHCSDCNKCVSNFDHHCKWLNNCIGGKNYRLFIYCVTSSLICTLQLVAISILLLILYQHRTSTSTSTPNSSTSLLSPSFVGLSSSSSGSSNNNNDQLGPHTIPHILFNTYNNRSCYSSSTRPPFAWMCPAAQIGAHLSRYIARPALAWTRIWPLNEWRQIWCDLELTNVSSTSGANININTNNNNYSSLASLAQLNARRHSLMQTNNRAPKSSTTNVAHDDHDDNSNTRILPSTVVIGPNSTHATANMRAPNSDATAAMFTPEDTDKDSDHHHRNDQQLFYLQGSAAISGLRYTPTMNAIASIHGAQHFIVWVRRVWLMNVCAVLIISTIATILLAHLLGFHMFL
ncbi:putative palmitoyltransferase ZDHHC11B, partial [Fragariocoptes setiger]